VTALLSIGLLEAGAELLFASVLILMLAYDLLPAVGIVFLDIKFVKGEYYTILIPEFFQWRLRLI
jgi:hypothetical protein